ncbi:anti-sigma factor [Rhodococcus qingshengii]|uniref:anti-sigma factor n=1 Tax=Rhodococcus qingshengii TaxID=334542 RepID=UPI0002B7C82C|nr:anti-sigma factor [Rhodococcus qingshengii]EME21335.1 anti-sigma factor [Rhodococcus qingshengii BKS 20-40]
MFINETTLLPSFSVPSRPDQLRLLRSMAGEVIAHRDSAPDDVADLVLAVDEAAGILLGHAQSSSHITCIFDLDAVGSLHVHLSTTTLRPIVMHTTSWPWVFLQSLVDDVILEHVPPTTENEHWTAIIVVKKTMSTAA